VDTILKGCFFDVQPEDDGSTSIWLIESIGNDSDQLHASRRLKLRLPAQALFYASGPSEDLRTLWKFYQSTALPVELSRSAQTILGQPDARPVLGVRTAHANWRGDLFLPAARENPALNHFNIDIPAYLHCAALYGALALSRVKVRVTQEGVIKSMQLIQPETPDESVLPELRVMIMEPDVNPGRKLPSYLRVEIRREVYTFSLQPERALLTNLAALLRRHDPDLILTAWGDTWLLPYLQGLSQKTGVALPLSRDEKQLPQLIGSRYTFDLDHHLQSFINLAGRWHVDRCSSRLFPDADLESLVEVARLTGMPVPLASRSSAGMAVASMQGLAALRRGILIPYRQPVSQEADLSAVTRSYLPPAGLYQSPGLLFDLLPQLLDQHAALAKQASTIAGRDSRSPGLRARLQAQEWILQAAFGRLGFWAFHHAAKTKRAGSSVRLQPQEILACTESFAQEGRHEV